MYVHMRMWGWLCYTA